MDATDEHMARIWDRVDGARVMVDCERCELNAATERLQAQVQALALAEMQATDNAAALALQLEEARTLVREAVPTVDVAGTLIVNPYTSLIQARAKWADWLARARALLKEDGEA